NYWGPFDGHNIREMETVFTLAKKYDKPVLIHLVTQKGKGYKKAELEPWVYHGISPGYAKNCGRSWSSATAEAVEKLAVNDPSIVCLTAAMKEGNKLNHFQERFPDRFFDVGIAEEHMLIMAAGMAAGGLKPCVFIYSTFLQRAMDQLVHDIAMQNLPVVLLVDRSGMIGEDGETHQGLLDISWGKAVPNLQIMAPRDVVDMNIMLAHAFKRNGPSLIRYPRGEACEKLYRKGSTPRTFDEKLRILQDGSDWVLIGLGNTVSFALETARISASRELPVPTVVDLRMVKPLDHSSLRKILASHSLAVILEEGYISGGVGEAIASFTNEEQLPCTVRKLGVPDIFLQQGTVEQQWQHCGITVDQVVNIFLEHQKGKTG
ncbi:MAG: 1-deoxy-D-xylulose-5-phosphate synthase, partial [Synergistales bacterium]|nr:1-deoxy-D-xylulose-5-phosphate synthase [Synergistales bacterium]